MNNTESPTTFPTHTDPADLRAIARKADTVICTAWISDGTDTYGMPRYRPATAAELDRVGRVGLVALAELETRGVATPRCDWLR